MEKREEACKAKRGCKGQSLHCRAVCGGLLCLFYHLDFMWPLHKGPLHTGAKRNNKQPKPQASQGHSIRKMCRGVVLEFLTETHRIHSYYDFEYMLDLNRAASQPAA
jgi:hypothetical protein